MRRRDFIKGFSAAATMSPLAAGAQQPERVRRIGVLLCRSPRAMKHRLVSRRSSKRSRIGLDRWQ
jgi:hypothetical protein